MIRAASTVDASAICAIYNHYVTASDATFEEAPVSVDGMARRIERTLTVWPWLAAEKDGIVIGYACANQWKPRSGYRHTVESKVYLDPAQLGRGTGSALFASLIERLQQRGAHCAIAGIACPTWPVSPCTRNSGSRKSLTSAKTASSSTAGLTSVTGDVCSEHARSRRADLVLCRSCIQPHNGYAYVCVSHARHSAPVQ